MDIFFFFSLFRKWKCCVVATRARTSVRVGNAAATINSRSTIAWCAGFSPVKTLVNTVVKFSMSRLNSVRVPLFPPILASHLSRAFYAFARSKQLALSIVLFLRKLGSVSQYFRPHVASFLRFYQSWSYSRVEQFCSIILFRWTRTGSRIQLDTSSFCII